MKMDTMTGDAVEITLPSVPNDIACKNDAVAVEKIPENSIIAMQPSPVCENGVGFSTFLAPATFLLDETLRRIDPTNEFNSDSLHRLHTSPRQRKRRSRQPAEEENAGGCMQPPPVNNNTTKVATKNRKNPPMIKLTPDIVARREFTIKMDHNEYKCQHAGCDKSFRKQVLLDKHMEHYHKTQQQTENSRPNGVNSKLACSTAGVDNKTMPKITIKRMPPPRLPANDDGNDDESRNDNKKYASSTLSLAGYYIGDQPQVMPLMPDADDDDDDADGFKTKDAKKSSTPKSLRKTKSTKTEKSPAKSDGIQQLTKSPNSTTKSTEVCILQSNGRAKIISSKDAIFTTSTSGDSNKDKDNSMPTTNTSLAASGCLPASTSSQATTTITKVMRFVHPFSNTTNHHTVEVVALPTTTSPLASTNNNMAKINSTLNQPYKSIGAPESMPVVDESSVLPRSHVLMWELTPPPVIASGAHIKPYHALPATTTTVVSSGSMSAVMKVSSRLPTKPVMLQPSSSVINNTPKKVKNYNLAPANEALRKRVLARQHGALMNGGETFKSSSSAMRTRRRPTVVDFADDVFDDEDDDDDDDDLVSDALGPQPFCADTFYADRHRNALDNYYSAAVIDDSFNTPSDEEDVIHCACGDNIKTGRIVRCDLCQAWCHAHCAGMDSEVRTPELFTCAFCLKPNNNFRSDMDARLFLQPRLVSFGEIPALPEPHAYYQARHRARVKGRPSRCDMTSESTQRQRQQHNKYADRADSVVSSLMDQESYMGRSRSSASGGGRESTAADTSSSGIKIDSVGHYMRLLGAIQQQKQLIAARRAYLLSQWKLFEQQYNKNNNNNNLHAVQQQRVCKADGTAASDKLLFSSFLNDAVEDAAKRRYSTSNCTGGVVDGEADPTRYNNTFSPTPLPTNAAAAAAAASVTGESHLSTPFQQKDMEQFLSRTHAMCGEVVESVAGVAKYVSRALKITAAANNNSSKNSNNIKRQKFSAEDKDAEKLRTAADVQSDIDSLRVQWNKLRGERLSRLRRKRNTVINVKKSTVNGRQSDSDDTEEETAKNSEAEPNDDNDAAVLVLPIGNVIAVSAGEALLKSLQANDMAQLPLQNINSPVYSAGVQARTDRQLCEGLLCAGFAGKLQPTGLSNFSQQQLMSTALSINVKPPSSIVKKRRLLSTENNDDEQLDSKPWLFTSSQQANVMLNCGNGAALSPSADSNNNNLSASDYGRTMPYFSTTTGRSSSPLR